MVIEMYQGDTIDLNVELTQNGEPFDTTDFEVVFSVSNRIGETPIFKLPIIDNYVKITHELTKDLSLGNYQYDVRIYDQSKSLVSTPCVGSLYIKGVVNNEI